MGNRHFITMYGAFHTNPEFHKKIADATNKVVRELEPDALEDFLHFESGLGDEDNLRLAMSIVYNLLESDIKDFYGYDISQEDFIGEVVLEDDFAEEDEAQNQPSCLGAVSGSYVYVISFFNYDHDIITHIFLDEKKAIDKHKNLQDSRKWGFYTLSKVVVE